MYTQPASTLTPGVICYLIDQSDSMNEVCGTITKIAMVNIALRATLKDMVRRSMRDGQLQRRYKIAIIGYNHEVHHLVNGIQDLSDILQQGIPELTASGATDTAGGFTAVEKLFVQHIGEFQHYPAPLICHLTDGLYSTENPAAVMKRLRSLQVVDGAVLLENIYVADTMLRKPPNDWRQWKGVSNANEISDDYARFLYKNSSLLPETYRQNINNYGYQLQAGAALFFPGTHSDLIRLAFAVSSATQLK